MGRTLRGRMSRAGQHEGERYLIKDTVARLEVSTESHIFTGF